MSVLSLRITSLRYDNGCFRNSLGHSVPWRLQFNMIIATYLVKNDSDIIRHSILHHLNSGVDAIIVTENNAVPETSSIIDEFEPYILIRIKEDGTNYNQSIWVTRMARLAAKYYPKWIFHSDADELWYGLENLGEFDIDYVSTEIWYNYLPYSIYEFDINKSVYYEQPIESSWFGEGMQSKRKVIHRSNDHIEIKQGNHMIKGVDHLPVCGVKIHHYPVRTYEQFEMKVITGGVALENSDLPEYMGKQWRRWYRNYKNGELLNVYKSFLATPENLSQALLDGRIVGPHYV